MIVNINFTFILKIDLDEKNKVKNFEKQVLHICAEFFGFDFIKFYSGMFLYNGKYIKDIGIKIEDLKVNNEFDDLKLIFYNVLKELNVEETSYNK